MSAPIASARRRNNRRIFFGFSAVSLAGAGLSGLWFSGSPMDMVLIQLVFYGAWWCLVGARVGGLLGAMTEEDCCSDLDMGVLSSMGSMIGTLSAGLVGTAVTGLSLVVLPWWTVWGVTVVVAVLHALFGAVRPLRVARLSHLDARGRVLGPDGRPLPEQPLRMPDQVAGLLAFAGALCLALTLVMARMMGSDFGHPVMMAPMMYGMFGTMIGGMLGGWLAGLLDEHQGHPDHDNPVMVSAMALMAGMMGGMPSGMIGGMMAIMGVNAIAVTVAAGLSLVGVAWAVVMRGRYRIERAVTESEGAEAERRKEQPEPRVGPGEGSVVLRVTGMSCDACRVKVTRKVGELPGVSAVDVDVAAGRVHVAWGQGFSGLPLVKERIERLGYQVEGEAE